MQIREVCSTVRINDHNEKLKVDTSARCNVMPFDLFKQVRGSEKIDTSRPVQLVSYSGDYIQTLGETVFKCCFAGKTRNFKFQIIEKEAKPLIGLQDSLGLQLVQINEIQEIKSVAIKPVSTLTKEDILHDYKDLFDGELGELPVQYNMKLNPDARPVV
jgi:hypothetical protein